MRSLYLVMAANMLVTVGRQSLRGFSWHMTTRSRFRLCRYSRPYTQTHTILEIEIANAANIAVGMFSDLFALFTLGFTVNLLVHLHK